MGIKFQIVDGGILMLINYDAGVYKGELGATRGIIISGLGC